MNIYVLCLKVVEVRSFGGAQSWWGGPLAYTGRSFIIYVSSEVYEGYDPTIINYLWTLKMPRLWHDCSTISRKT
jgi:hypothetical protein